MSATNDAQVLRPKRIILTARAAHASFCFPEVNNLKLAGEVGL